MPGCCSPGSRGSKNIAKSRMEMSGQKPIEVDAVTERGEWASWCGHDCGDEYVTEKESDQEDADIDCIGKSGKKGGRGFQGHCYT